MYARYIKRLLDIICSLLALICFCWLYIVVAILVRIKLGSPIIFKQPRPGKDEKIFSMYKFRTMTDERDKNGSLLPDEERLTPFGKKLRATSLDELPEVFNIIKGDMSIIGPRPQLVKDMVFMTSKQRQRHMVRPGLSGLAQVNGRNAISWESKLNYDIKYISKITFLKDVNIILRTVLKAFFRQEGINENNMATSEDFGDYLLRTKQVTREEYRIKLDEVNDMLSNEVKIKDEELVSIIMPSYNTANYIEESIESVINQTFTNWELIIVDDCSFDNTDDVIAKYLNDERIIYLKNEKNRGAAISRNRALRKAKGKWVAFLDSDDLWSTNKLEKQIKFMKENNYSFTYTNYYEMDEKSKLNGVTVTGPKHITRRGMYNYCWPGCLTVMYDVSVVGLVQIKDIKKNNDYAMWLQICHKCDCYLLDEQLAKYRKRQGSISNHSYLHLLKWHFKLYYKKEKKNILTAVFNTGRNLIFGLYKKKFYLKFKNIEE